MAKTQSPSSPTFSVVIPAHDRPALLRRTIRSVIEQTYDDFELIVVDDASSEDLESVAESFGDSRVRYLRREQNGSAGAARNTGIRNARGEFVAFIDDDDEFFPQYLEEMAATLKDAPPEVGFAWCGVRRVEYEDGSEKEERDRVWTPSYASRKEAHLGFIRHRKIGTNCGIAVRREAFEIVGLFDERMKKAEDTDFLIRIVRHFDFAIVRRPLVRVHRHGGDRLTNYDDRMADAYRLMVEKHESTFRQYPETGAQFLYKAGWVHYHGNKRSLGRHYMLRSLRLSPLHARRWGIFFLFELTGGGERAQAWHVKLSNYRKQIVRSR